MTKEEKKAVIDGLMQQKKLQITHSPAMHVI